MATAITATENAVQLIPLNRIVPSPTNPRKTFNPDSLADLADSIREKGVLQPILVRKVGQELELVAGERRWLAAGIAGLREIPAIVRELDDRAALEIQVIENLQREDLSVLEEAEGYRRLVDEHAYTVEQLAEKLGKSKAYLYGRLKLTELPEKAKIALADGSLPASTAQLIARIPNAQLREKATKALYNDWAKEFQSYRDAKRVIERDFMVELKGAPFNRKDAQLLPGAGACDSCPKMTGNNRDLYPEGRADVCTDPGCFRQKIEAHQKRQLEKAEKKGLKVLTPQQSAKLFDYFDQLRWDVRDQWIELSEKCEADGQAQTYKQLLGDSITPTVATDGKGKLHYLAPRDEVVKILEDERGIKLDGRKVADSSWQKEQRERERQREIRLKAAEAARKQAHVKLHKLIWPDTHADWLRLLRISIPLLLDLDDLFGGLEVVLKDRGIENELGETAVELCEPLFESASAEEMIATVVEVQIADALEGWARFDSEVSTRRAAALLECLGLDLTQLEAEAKAALAPAKKGKGRKAA